MLPQNELTLSFSTFFSYSKNAKTISDCYRDQIQTPLKTAVFWVNYVARHQGAPNLRSYSVELPIYALYNIDVWAFVLTILAIFCSVVFLIIRLLVCSSRTNVINSKKSDWLMHKIDDNKKLIDTLLWESEQARKYKKCFIIMSLFF